MDKKRGHAVRRLHRDWKELSQETESLTTVAALPTSDILLWHCNLRPDSGPYAGTIFHLVLRFPEDYPHKPPDVQLCTHLSHPNVYNWREEGYSLCLDMIQEHYTSTPYAGWTSAYSVLSILLQLQSFLFATRIPQHYGFARARSSKTKVENAIRLARRFQYGNIWAYDGTIVRHTHQNPWPPLPEYKGKPGYQVPLTLSEKRIQEQQCAEMKLQQSSQPSNEDMVPPSLKTKPEATSLRRTEKIAFAASILPSDTYVKIFSFLDPKGLIKARDVCAHWRDVVLSYNIFERTQMRCFHSKITLDDDEKVVLGFGLKVSYYPDRRTVKSISSPLDLLSSCAFDEEGVRTGVWGGENDSFEFFLPLILNDSHAARCVERIEQTIHRIMQNTPLPSFGEDEGPSRGCQQKRREVPKENERKNNVQHTGFHPYMAFQFLATLMNSMVVELMNSSEAYGSVSRFASEKSLDGFCAFHHMLLYFARKYPTLHDFADKQIDRFLSSFWFRHKIQTPNLGILMIGLALSRRDWDSLRKPLVMEAFDRNVRWLTRKYPELSGEMGTVSPADRLRWTFEGSKTSLRLLMFQTYFMMSIGRPTADAAGRSGVLDQYSKQLGKPTLVQKEDLQRNAKAILDVSTWPQFFHRLGSGSVPSSARLVEILEGAVANSLRKKYHIELEVVRQRQEERRRQNRERRDARLRRPPAGLTLGDFL